MWEDVEAKNLKRCNRTCSTDYVADSSNIVFFFDSRMLQIKRTLRWIIYICFNINEKLSGANMIFESKIYYVIYYCLLYIYRNILTFSQEILNLFIYL